MNKRVSKFFFMLLFLLSSAALSEQSPSPGDAAGVTRTTENPSSMLEYAKFLREEEKSHREYLERLYTNTTLVLGFLATVGIGFIGFLQFKSRKDVREAVDAQFRATVEKELQKSVERFEKELADARQAMEDEVGRLGAEVRSRVEEMYATMSEPESTKEEPQVTMASMDEREQKILRLIGESQYSFRSLTGIAREATQKGLDATEVEVLIANLVKKGVIGKTLGKKGGERWYVTEAGRKQLM